MMCENEEKDLDWNKSTNKWTAGMSDVKSNTGIAIVDATKDLSDGDFQQRYE